MKRSFCQVIFVTFFVYSQSSLTSAPTVEPEIAENCIDTRGWTNGGGKDCDFYQSEGLCINGMLLESWKGGEQYQFPEYNCCICGRGDPGKGRSHTTPSPSYASVPNKADSGKGSEDTEKSEDSDDSEDSDSDYQLSTVIQIGFPRRLNEEDRHVEATVIQFKVSAKFRDVPVEVKMSESENRRRVLLSEDEVEEKKSDHGPYHHDVDFLFSSLAERQAEELSIHVVEDLLVVLQNMYPRYPLNLMQDPEVIRPGKGGGKNGKGGDKNKCSIAALNCDCSHGGACDEKLKCNEDHKCVEDPLYQKSNPLKKVLSDILGSITLGVAGLSASLLVAFKAFKKCKNKSKDFCSKELQVDMLETISY